jgi:hypothetical protein
VEVVQLRGLVVGIQGRDQGVAGRFHRAVRDADEQRREEQRPVAAREHRQHDAEQVEQEGHHQQLLHADDVDDEAADHDGKREAPEGRRRDRGQLGGVQVELDPEPRQHAGPDAERQRSHEQGGATRPEKGALVDVGAHAIRPRFAVWAGIGWSGWRGPPWRLRV